MTDTFLEAQWVVDSETGEQYLLNLQTGDILAKKDEDGKWIKPGDIK